MKTQAITKEQLSQLEKTLQSDSESPVNYHQMYNNHFFDSLDNELMIRDNVETHIKTMTIARIAVNHKGIGVATNLINQIEKIAKENGAKFLVIESILTDEMLNLADKLGFESDSYNPYNKFKDLSN